MKKVNVEKRELQLIPIERTSLIVPEKKPRHRPKKRRPAAGEILSLILMGIAIMQAVVIYILQAGPI